MHYLGYVFEFLIFAMVIAVLVVAMRGRPDPVYKLGPFGPPALRETLKSRLLRFGFNCFPCYVFTGGKIIHIAPDLREIRMRLPLNWRTRNYVGTIFGGSMFGASDPVLMLMLIHLLGKDFVVWDKAASIRFRKPGRSVLFARFSVSDQDLDNIRDGLRGSHKLDYRFRVDLVDVAGTVHAEIERVVNIRRKV